MLYYYGVRYLDPKYSMWISTDPALSDYIPAVGKATTDEASKLPGVGGVFNTVNLNLYHYGANNPVIYTDPTGMFDKKQFCFAALQTFGGVAEVVGGCVTSGVSAGVTIYAVVDGVYNIADGITGMVAAVNDKEWDGFIPEAAAKIADNFGANDQTQELISSYANLADTIIDGIATKGVSLVGDGSQSISAMGKIIDSIDSCGSSISEIDTIIDVSKETYESVQEYVKNIPTQGE